MSSSNAVRLSPDHPFDRLVSLMETLRGRDGCAWDRAQTLETLRGYAIEELYEVIDAIDEGSSSKHMEELGDLLLQIVFQSRIQEEAGAFSIWQVCDAITSKMERRHPHVFGDVRASSAEEAHASWEKSKAAERARRSEAGLGFESVLAGVPRAMPSLLRGLRLAEKAATVGFDWENGSQVFAKVREEIGELEEAIEVQNQESIRHELGDLLLAMTNLARHLRVEPESALREANDRFTARFQHLEQEAFERGEDLNEMTLEELEQRWQRAKQALAAEPG
ncbi:MAG: nucleoside triphosphate pyrophosphohydrolase [Rickettsiales bacterium]|nr:nucleoside triphosphate pyrophosphohydrolase [Rickettsiales bacterium]